MSVSPLNDMDNDELALTQQPFQAKCIQIGNLELYFLQDVSGDGNCFFNSVIPLISRIHGEQYSSDSLRAFLVDWAVENLMTSHHEQFNKLCFKYFGTQRSADEVLHDIATDREWANWAVIEVCARAFAVNVCVLSDRADCNYWFAPCQKYADIEEQAEFHPTIFLMYFNHSEEHDPNHFAPLHSLDILTDEQRKSLSDWFDVTKRKELPKGLFDVGKDEVPSIPERYRVLKRYCSQCYDSSSTSKEANEREKTNSSESLPVEIDNSLQVMTDDEVEDQLFQEVLLSSMTISESPSQQDAHNKKRKYSHQSKGITEPPSKRPSSSNL